MISFLDLPEFQSAVAPFLASLVCALLFYRFKPMLSGLGLVLGFLTTVLLVTGLPTIPLTASSRIIVTTLVAALVGLSLDWIKLKDNYHLGIMILFMALALFWTLGKILLNMEGSEFWLYTLGGLMYVSLLTIGLEKLKDRPLPLHSATIALASGTGISAILGASALLGQLSSALAAAAGALLLLSLLLQKPPTGSNISLTTAAGTGLLGLGAVILSSMPWYTLLFFPLIPLIGFIPENKTRFWLKSTLFYFFPAMLIASVAVLSVWLGMEESTYGY